MSLEDKISELAEQARLKLYFTKKTDELMNLAQDVLEKKRSQLKESLKKKSEKGECTCAETEELRRFEKV
jgi:hypothetical protein